MWEQPVGQYWIRPYRPIEILLLIQHGHIAVNENEDANRSSFIVHVHSLFGSTE